MEHTGSACATCYEVLKYFWNLGNDHDQGYKAQSKNSNTCRWCLIVDRYRKPDIYNQHMAYNSKKSNLKISASIYTFRCCLMYWLRILSFLIPSLRFHKKNQLHYLYFSQSASISSLYVKTGKWCFVQHNSSVLFYISIFKQWLRVW
jgi:hypothetical protein